MKAIFNGQIIAESSETIHVEGNQYFPPNSIKREFFKNSEFHTVCHWKGEASYMDVVVDGQENKDAAWYYPSPSKMADKIKDYVAFWRGVEVIK